MKPFNLEEAKAGKPVCTGNGKDVTIYEYNLRGVFPILAVIHSDDLDSIAVYTLTGKYNSDNDHTNDLFMKPEKKTGWINIYKINSYTGYTGIYTTKDDALNAKDSNGYITTIKIEWEE